MAVGGYVDGEIGDFGGRITVAVVITCIVAASGGLIFGYDIGISGGVTIMPSFLNKFFPSILEKSAKANNKGNSDMYCMYDSHLLTSFTSSLYIAGLVSSLAASRTTITFGRKFTMLLGGFTFLIGAAINGGAEDIAMLIIGRIFLGFGVGFTNQAAPVYLSEVAPARWRGAFNTGFQFFIAIGVVAANCINYRSSKISWGWRLSLGLAGAPAVIMILGAIFIPDTPSSLIHRGKPEQAKRALSRIRGGGTGKLEGADVDGELSALASASEIAKLANEEPFVTIFQRQYRPHLVMAVLIPFFQQLTGIDIIAFYAPVLFQSVGFGKDSALIASIILGSVNLVSIIMSTFVVDRFGRRFLFIAGGIQMLLCQVAAATVLAANSSSSSGDDQMMSRGHAVLVLVLLCLYANGFGWSWGPLNWLVPSEIMPLRIRPTGQSISVAVNFATTFVLSQTFLSMLCHFRYGVFLFHAGWVVVMTLFMALFLPETKGIPLESMHVVWKKHWYWRRFTKDY